jgi:hypothetical protein
MSLPVLTRLRPKDGAPGAIHLSFDPETGSSRAIPSQPIRTLTADLNGYIRHLHVSASGLLLALGVTGIALA